MDKRCKTCTWWDADVATNAWSSDGGPGNYPATWNRCARSFREWHGNPVPDGALMIVDGYEVAGLYTAPEFGCVQWEHEGEES